MEREILFSTPHGSHLYGLATPTSDRDFYTVVTRLPHVAHNGTRARYAKQTIKGQDDNFVIDLSTFMLLCEKGVPQALEAMFSRCPTEDRITDLRFQYRVGTAVLPTYLRTIKSFIGAGDFKRRRHAFRLALNAADIAKYGRFNPRLSEADAEWITDLAKPQDLDAAYELAQDITHLSYRI